MKARSVMMVILTILLAAAGLGAYLWSTRPVVTEILPVDGADNIPVASQIQLVFSRPMNREQLINHLAFEPNIKGVYSWKGNTLTYTPDQPLPSGRKININLEPGALAVSWLSLPLAGGSWSFTTSDANLAYLWPSDGPADIYLLNPTSGDIIQATYSMDVLEYTPSWDGMKLFFSANNAQGGSDLYQINRLDISTGKTNPALPKKLLECGLAQCRLPEVSSDGTYLAYEYLLPDPKGGLGPAQIWLMNLTTGEVRPIGLATHETVQPAWSSQDWLAYYDRNTLEYVAADPQTNEQTLLPNQTGQPGSWSPDGEYYLAPEIYYHPSSGISETGTSHLLRYRVQDGDAVDISNTGSVEDVEGEYSPDGRLIAFARKFLDAERWSFGRQIWLMKSDGSDPHPLTHEADYNHYDISWSRNSLMLAYVRFNQARLSELPELWMINADGSNPVQLVIGGYSPIWIP